MIINKDLANQKVATAYGELSFDAKGESHDLTEAHQKHIGEKVRGFTYLPDNTRAEKKKEEVRKEEIAQQEEAAIDGKAEALTAGEDKAKAMIPNDKDKAAAMNEDTTDKKNAEGAPKAKRSPRAKK